MVKAKLFIEFKGLDVESGVEKFLDKLSGDFDQLSIKSKRECTCANGITIESQHQVELGQTIIIINIPKCISGENTGIPGVLNSLFYMSVFSFISKFYILEIDLPDSILATYSGPRFGIDGIRNTSGVLERPILGLILKPRMALNVEAVPLTIKTALSSGIDYIVDDELNTNSNCQPIQNRMSVIQSAIDEYNKEHGTNKFFIANAVAEQEQAIEIIETGLKYNVKGYLLNTITQGFSSAKHIIDYFDGRAFFIINNIGKGIVNRMSDFHVSDAVYCKLNRMIGADGVYTGPSQTDYAFNEAQLDTVLQAMQGDFAHIKESMLVSSGAITTRDIVQNHEELGDDCMLQLGRGLLNSKIGFQKACIKVYSITEAISSSTQRRKVEKNHHMKKESFTKSISQGRISDINSNIYKEYQIIKQLEDQLRLENRVIESEQIKENISQCRIRIEQALLEIDDIKQREQLSEVEHNFWNEDKNKILDYAINNVDKYLSDKEAESLASEILAVLSRIDTKPDMSSIPRFKIESTKAQATNPELNAKDKLKITIPIVPYIFRYEKELSLDMKFSLKHVWSSLINKFK
ncbi:RuBisCO large subunit C-terminal-like domain-containing protein [Maridesulfovibrio sp.]|uniref:RuBisCO large subunit C-terminal-like domain-containing protein n=1 Tax=Maridesulfovibrio sp. TaxID=2795000 RepID=UPI003BACD1A1